MFKNREFRVRLAKTDNNEETAPTLEEVLNPDSAKLIEEAGKRLVKYTTIAIGAIIVTAKLADTLSEIAVKKTKSADKD